MELNEYQKQAMTTCMGTCDNFSYMMLNLMGEVGEFAGKVAKMIRKGQVEIDTMDEKTSDLFPMVSLPNWVYHQGELMKEAGDILWQLAGLCNVMGWDLETVAQQNLKKLASRKERGVIDGSGDNR
jgi:NTP pyrophosphatase (non-canonical NTP hydrolase)